MHCKGAVPDDAAKGKTHSCELQKGLTISRFFVILKFIHSGY